MTTKAPLVSIVTPTYNSKFLERTVASVLDQTFDDWELILSDDCSTDNTRDVATRLAQSDARIRTSFTNWNGGPGIARNRAIDIAEGRYIAFLDSDDIWFPDKLEKQLEFARQHNVALTCGWVELIGAETAEPQSLGRVVKSPEVLTYQTMLRCNYVPSVTAMYDRELCGKVYMPTIQKRQDYALWLKILKKGHTARCMQEAIAYYRTGNSASVSGNKFVAAKMNWRMYRETEKMPLFTSIYALVNYMFRAPLRNAGYRV